MEPKIEILKHGTCYILTNPVTRHVIGTILCSDKPHSYSFHPLNEETEITCEMQDEIDMLVSLLDKGEKIV